MARPHDNILVLIDGSPPFVGNDRFAPMIEFIRDDPNIRTVIYAAFWERRLPPRDADLNRVFGDTRVKRCSEASMSLLDYMRFFRILSARNPSIRVVPIRELFCQRTTCRMDPAGTVLCRDSNHLNVLDRCWWRRRSSQCSKSDAADSDAARGRRAEAGSAECSVEGRRPGSGMDRVLSCLGKARIIPSAAHL
jgi:hypothetical protein